WAAAVAVAKILGYLGESVLVPVVLVAPLAVWWLVAATIAARRAEDVDETEDADEEPQGDGGELGDEDTPDVQWSVAALEREGLWIDEPVPANDSPDEPAAAPSRPERDEARPKPVV
ncbi:MAG: hypothetical protein AAGF91_15050, partial [Actinomycetota bacterium]